MSTRPKRSHDRQIHQGKASRPTVKTKAKRGSKLLLAPAAEVRKTKPQSRQPVPLTPMVADQLAMFSAMDRVVQAYVELPGRLARCHSPFDMWREQVLFAQRIFS
jgi:hypothetical protein